MRGLVVVFSSVLVISSSRGLQISTVPASKGADKTTSSGPPLSLSPEQKHSLLDQLKSGKLEDRLTALHQLVGHDRSLPILKDKEIRAAIVDLFKRETSNGRQYDIGERTDFQYYYDFLGEAVQKIAVDYGTPESWRLLVYSNYGPESVFGRWIAKQPQSLPLLLSMIDDQESGYRHKGLIMLGEICATNSAQCPKILPILRERVSSTDFWTQQGAMVALGVCGTADDVTLLRNLPACSTQWAASLLCKQVEDKITKRLAQQPPP